MCGPVQRHRHADAHPAEIGNGRNDGCVSVPDGICIIVHVAALPHAAHDVYYTHRVHSGNAVLGKGRAMRSEAGRRMVAKLASAVQRLQLIAPVDWLKRIDAWRRHQPNLPSRSEAIRRLVELGLDAAQRGEKKPPKG
jgi:hypothetical protein